MSDDKPTFWERVARLDIRPNWRRRFLEAYKRRSEKLDEKRKAKVNWEDSGA